MEKTDKEQKAEMIKAIAEALDRNTTSMHQIWCIIHVMQDACEFMEDKRYKYRNDVSMSIRYMRESLKDNSSAEILYDDITDDLLESIMISGANAEGLIALNSKSMKADLHEISDIYNS